MSHEVPIREARVLAIDDEPTNLRLLEMIFSKAGYAYIETLSDSTIVAEIFGKFKPDIVLLDLHMPQVDGFKVLEILRPMIPREEFMPILILTADVMPEVKKRALGAGASDFVTKPFDADEVLLRVRNLLVTRSSHQRIANQNQLLESMVKERTAELSMAYGKLQDAQMETLKRLALAAEYRDDETGLHTRRVGDCAARLAGDLGLSADEVELYRRAAPLHDIGKIGIPDAILLKPGRLTLEEFEVVKTHTIIGGSILSGSDSPLLQLAGEIALSHHERWDGTGYPHHLAGKNIPLSGRIVSVCDVFDALTHSRPYKSAWTIEAAIKEIADQSGRQFDPSVVEAFLASNKCGTR